MKFPWSFEKVFCKNEKELARLLMWAREQSLSQIGRTEYVVTAVLPGLVDTYNDGPKIIGYYVDLPYQWVEARASKIGPQEAMKDILEGTG